MLVRGLKQVNSRDAYGGKRKSRNLQIYVNKGVKWTGRYSRKTSDLVATGVKHSRTAIRCNYRPVVEHGFS